MNATHTPSLIDNENCDGFHEKFVARFMICLDMSLKHSIPFSLLILFRLRPEEAVWATVSSLPDDVMDTGSERRRKLEFLEIFVSRASASCVNLDLLEEKEEEEEKARMKESVIGSEDDDLSNNGKKRTARTG
ncbi:hypothetical protein LguiB_013328 [Lonicera macranthoides]